MNDDLKILITGSLNTAATISEINTKIKQIESKLSNVNLKVNADTQSLDKLNNSMKQITNSQSHQSVNAYQNSLSNISTTATTTSSALNNLQNNVAKTSTQLNNGATSAFTFGDMLTQAIKKFAIWMTAANAIYAPVRAIQDMTHRLIELDTQMTNIRRVMDAPEYKFNDLLRESIDLTDQLSGKLSDFMQLVEEVVRMGYSMNEALDLASTAQILQNISDLNANQSISTLISSLINFNIAAEDSIEIASKLNEVDNNFSVTTLQLSQALNKSAATARNFGVELDTVLGNITAIASSTRESGAPCFI